MLEPDDLSGEADAEVVDPEVGLAVSGSSELHPPPALFGPMSDPQAAVNQMRSIAVALSGVITEHGLSTRIQTKQGPRDHVRVEGWTTLGAMVGVFPATVWTRRVTDPDGWEAKVEARTLGGALVGAAEMMCTKDEKRWKFADDYAIRSMAQTRATSKALSQPLRFIVSMAGYHATPAEEVPEEPRAPERYSANGVKAEMVKLMPKVDKEKLVEWWEANHAKEFDEHATNGTVTSRRCEIIVSLAFTDLDTTSPFEEETTEGEETQ